MKSILSGWWKIVNDERNKRYLYLSIPFEQKTFVSIAIKENMNFFVILRFNKIGLRYTYISILIP